MLVFSCSPRVVHSYMGHIQATAERAVRDMLRQFSVDQVSEFACMCACLSVCVYVRMRKFVRVCAHAKVCVCLCVSVRLCVCDCWG